ncbi:DNA-binding transcriptional LysR family regulator [Bradyrhizobium liaoningense]
MIPPLNPLHVFDVAARHLSFTRAARELRVTQPAVSRQVTILEAFLGVRLFERDKAGLRLTSEGNEFHPADRAGLPDHRPGHHGPDRDRQGPAAEDQGLHDVRGEMADPAAAVLLCQLPQHQAGHQQRGCASGFRER